MMFDFYGSTGGGNGMKPPSRRLGKRRLANRPRQRPRQRKPELSAEARDWREFYKLLRERATMDGEAPGSRGCQPPPRSQYLPLSDMIRVVPMVTRFRLDKVLGDTMSQGELARRSGVGRATISRIFNNQTTRVDLAVLDRLASELGCTPGDLLEQVRPNRKKKHRV